MQDLLSYSLLGYKSYLISTIVDGVHFTPNGKRAISLI